MAKKQNGAHESDPTPEVTEEIPVTEKPKVKITDKPVELLNKLVAKNIVTRKAMTYHKNADGEVTDDAPRALYRIWGVAQAVKHGDSAYGQWTSFEGNFKAVRFADGQIFQSATAFLQGPSEDLLLDALIKAQKADPAASVRFAFDIGVRPSAKWLSEDKGNSYEYTIRTVLESQEHDPLAELTAEAMKSLPQLSHT